MKRIVLLMVGIACVLGPVLAQKQGVRYVADADLPVKWLRNTSVDSPAQLDAAHGAQLAALYAQGHLEASVDSCVLLNGQWTCTLHVGKAYRWARLRTSGVALELSSQAGFREKQMSGRPVSPVQLARIMEALLTERENNGHPFAKVWLDSLKQVDEGLHATLCMDQGPAVLIDSVIVRGTARSNMRYLQAYIGVRPGSLYNESTIAAIERRIRELPFVTQKQRPYVQFSADRTKLYLFLDHRKASSINGVLGLQPDATTGKVTLTGDVDLKLRNALRRGEGIMLNWRRLQDATQDLRLGADMPFLFNSPFGASGNLRIFRRDTTFLELNARGAVDYLMGRGDKVSLFINTKNSTRLGSNLVSVPGLADVRILSYGLGTERERFDYRFNPRRGHSTRIEGSIGRKRTTTAVLTAPGAEPAPVIPEIRTVQFEVNGTLVGHLPIKRRSTLRAVVQGGTMVNKDLHRNELYRIGGLRSMRGVDEASIFCSSYTIGTLEYRYVYEENANFFLFVDQGWWEDRSGNTLITDAPLGFGAGTTFETKAGLFSLSYALGREFGAPVQLRGGKVHFGFVSLF